MLLQKKLKFITLFIFLTLFTSIAFNCQTSKKTINKKKLHQSSIEKNSKKNSFESSFFSIFKKKIENSIKFKEKPSLSFFNVSYFQFDDIFFKNISTFHTLIVHFPLFIVLLAFTLYLIYWIKKDRIYLKLNFYIMLLSSIIVILSIFLFFPETINLSEKANAVLKKHIYFALSTLIFNLLITILLGIQIWWKGKLTTILENNFWIKSLILIFFSYNLLVVSLTTFYGEVLVKQFKIGIQGNNIKK